MTISFVDYCMMNINLLQLTTQQLLCCKLKSAVGPFHKLDINVVTFRCCYFKQIFAVIPTHIPQFPKLMPSFSEIIFYQEIYEVIKIVF